MMFTAREVNTFSSLWFFSCRLLFFVLPCLVCVFHSSSLSRLAECEFLKVLWSTGSNSTSLQTYSTCNIMYTDTFDIKNSHFLQCLIVSCLISSNCKDLKSEAKNYCVYHWLVHSFKQNMSTPNGQNLQIWSMSNFHFLSYKRFNLISVDF